MDLTLEHRSTEGNAAPFQALAAELVQLPVDLIVVGDSRAIPIVMAATSTIPIVMSVSGDVVGLGLVDSLARPGGNLTGLTDFSRTLNTKRLELLVQSVPGASRVAVLWNGSHPGMALVWDEIDAAAQAPGALGVELIRLPVQDSGDLKGAFAAAFATAKSQGADALLVLPDPFTNVNSQQIVALAAQYELPAMYGTKYFMDHGGLMYYGPSRATMSRRAADYVDKILKGARPADLPIGPPTEFEFIVNSQTAQALGLTIAQSAP
jgi:putative ABC transport system substrate-binding protein